MENKLRTQTEEAAGSLLKRAKTGTSDEQAAKAIADAAKVRAAAQAVLVG